ncbi:GPP34 family phosphoprotein [Nocardia sp. NPDC020380]|uniref:GPP34 family phosphoprotein n=1 Tax=Nocardia sp. NPDC020380 TaxID=3364309 RepID=UPI0037A12CA4
MTPLIAEDLLWLLHDDRTGEPLVTRPILDRVLAGAVLLELTTPTTAETDPLLTDASARIGDTELRPVELTQRLGRGLRAALLARLIAAGKVRRENARVLGVFAVHGWPTTDVLGKQQLRLQLRRVLLDAHAADARTEALIKLLSLVHALGPQCADWAPELIEHRAEIQGHRQLCPATVAVVERAVCLTQAARFTGAA